MFSGVFGVLGVGVHGSDSILMAILVIFMRNNTETQVDFVVNILGIIKYYYYYQRFCFELVSCPKALLVEQILQYW